MDQVSDEKTSKFLSAINSYAQKQRNALSKEAERVKQAEKIRVEDEILQDAFNLIRREMSDMQTSISSERSKKIMASRKRLFDERTKILKSVFEEAKKKIKDFVSSKDYQEYFKKRAEEIKKGIKKKDEILLYIKKEDEVLKEFLLKTFGEKSSINFDSKIKLGGVRLECIGSDMIIDDTLDAKLEDQVEWFCENSGLYIE